MQFLKWQWNLGAILIILLILIPIAVIVFHLPFLDKDTLHHLSEHVLMRYVSGSLKILFGVLALTFILGVSTAFLIAFYDFFGSKILEWVLILPLAIPAYIMGFVWVNLLEFEGVIPTLLGIDKRIDIMNIYGTILLLSLALYPYVYFFVKNNFSKNLGNILLSAQTLSASNLKIFWKIVLPFCRISIIGSLSLVGMEVLSEYGLVSYFGVDTFSAGIFRTWLNGGDETSGIALASMLILFVFVLLAIESIQRGNRKYTQKQFVQTPKRALKGIYGFLAFAWCFVILFFAFIIPMVWLLYWGFYDFFANLPKFIEAIYYSLFMSIFSAFFIVWISYYLCFVVRLGESKFSQIILKISTLGYAIPGAVIAMGILLFLGFINKNIFEPLNIAYALGGGFGILFFGYLIRFLASGVFSLESSYANISKNIDYSSIVLKSSPFSLLFKIHLPLLKSSLALVFVVVAIDILKELPISTILSSSGFQTLSAAAFSYAENEQIYNTALPSVFIVLFALIPTLAMHFLQKNGAE